jgi:hypothetical protein
MALVSINFFLFVHSVCTFGSGKKGKIWFSEPHADLFKVAIDCKSSSDGWGKAHTIMKEPT